jgi:hypothetical protein
LPSGLNATPCAPRAGGWPGPARTFA